MSDDTENRIARRILDDGRIVELWRMLFNTRLTVTEPSNDGICWADCWCFDAPIAALSAFATYDGEQEPDGWVKHPPSGRRRPDGTPASERIDRD